MMVMMKIFHSVSNSGALPKNCRISRSTPRASGPCVDPVSNAYIVWYYHVSYSTTLHQIVPVKYQIGQVHDLIKSAYRQA